MSSIAVIIIHHTGDLIYKCIKSIQHIHCDKIVCSSQPTIFPGVVSKCVPHNNPARKRNEATKLVSGDYLAFLDDDVYLERSCLQVMQMYLDLHDDVGMCFATLSKTNGEIDCAGTYLLPTGFLLERTEQHGVNPYSSLSGKSSCCMIRKRLFHDIGEFDEDFFIYGEETDLSWRVWLQGFRVAQLPFALGTHYSESKEKELKYYNKHFIFYHGCKNYIMMLVKNLGGTHVLIALVNFVLWSIVGLLFVFKSPTRAIWIFQGLWYNIRHLPQTLRKRNKIQKERAISEDLLFPFIYRHVGLGYYLKRLWEYLTHPHLKT